MTNEDPNAAVIILRTLSIVLFLMTFGMLSAWIFGWLDVSPVISLSLMTVSISLLVVAQSTAKNAGKPD